MLLWLFFGWVVRLHYSSTGAVVQDCPEERRWGRLKQGWERDGKHHRKQLCNVGIWGLTHCICAPWALRMIAVGPDLLIHVYRALVRVSWLSVGSQTCTADINSTGEIDPRADLSEASFFWERWRRQRSEQYFTSFQQAFNFLRQVNGRRQTGHILVGRSDFERWRGMEW